MPYLENTPIKTPPPLVFETKRLRLRAMKAEDAKLIFELYASDPESTRYMSFKCTGRLEDTATFTRGVDTYFKGDESPMRQFAWVMELKSDGTAVGSSGFGPKNEFTLTGGYILGKKFWGQGYATEAWGCLVEWAKTQPLVQRIEAFHEAQNLPSGRIMQKVGMSFEGILRRQTIFPNIGEDPRDVAVYSWVRDS